MRRLLKSFGFAMNGLVVVWREQTNFRIHVAVLCAVLVTGWVVELTVAEWAIVLLCAGLVLAAELFNSAIEKMVDWVHPQWNEPAGKIKDIAAAAVLIAAVAAALVGIVIFANKFT